MPARNRRAAKRARVEADHPTEERRQEERECYRQAMEQEQLMARFISPGDDREQARQRVEALTTAICADCGRPRLPGRVDADGQPLHSLCAWCYACRRFPRPASERVFFSFAETQTHDFRELSKNIMLPLLNYSPADQYNFWEDQLYSDRSFPLCSFMDRTSDNLICSLFAWASLDVIEPIPQHEELVGLYNMRAQALDHMVQKAADYFALDEREQYDLRARHDTPHDELRAAEQYWEAYRNDRRLERRRWNKANSIFTRGSAGCEDEPCENEDYALAYNSYLDKYGDDY